MFHEVKYLITIMFAIKGHIWNTNTIYPYPKGDIAKSIKSWNIFWYFCYNVGSSVYRNVLISLANLLNLKVKIVVNRIITGRMYQIVILYKICIWKIGNYKNFPDFPKKLVYFLTYSQLEEVCACNTLDIILLAIYFSKLVPVVVLLSKGTTTQEDNFFTVGPLPLRTWHNVNIPVITTNIIVFWFGKWFTQY